MMRCNLSAFIDSILKQTRKDTFWSWELRVLTQKSGPSLYMAISRAIKAGELESLKPGLYCLTKPYRRSIIPPAAVGAFLYKNAYLSLESAMSFAGLIPEAVQTHYFGTSLRAKIFENSFGRFHFIHIPASPFFAGVILNISDEISVRVASPLRALADLCYHRNLEWQGIEALIQNYRIELNPFLKASNTEWRALKESFCKSRSVVTFLTYMQKELGK